jgi:hypothetical protein
MNVKTHSAALNGTLKAEGKKAMKDQPAASRKIAKPKSPVAKPKKAVAPKKTSKPKQKVVRRSFTMPESEYIVITTLKKQLISAGIIVKKSDLLRAGIKELSKLSHIDLNKKMSKLYLNV